VLHYAFLPCSYQNASCYAGNPPACRVPMSDAKLYDPSQGLSQSFPYPLAQWFQDTREPIIVDRVLRSDGTWAVEQSTFVAVPLVAANDLKLLMQQYTFFAQLPPVASDLLDYFGSIQIALAQGRQGLLGPSRDWFVVYAPRIGS